MTDRKKKAAMSRWIRSLRGCIKPKPGEKPFAVQMAEFKAEEKRLEEAKLQRIFGSVRLGRPVASPRKEKTAARSAMSRAASRRGSR